MNFGNRSETSTSFFDIKTVNEKASSGLNIGVRHLSVFCGKNPEPM